MRRPQDPNQRPKPGPPSSSAQIETVTPTRRRRDQHRRPKPELPGPTVMQRETATPIRRRRDLRPYPMRGPPSTMHSPAAPIAQTRPSPRLPIARQSTAHRSRPSTHRQAGHPPTQPTAAPVARGPARRLVAQPAPRRHILRAPHDAPDPPRPQRADRRTSHRSRVLRPLRADRRTRRRSPGPRPQRADRQTRHRSPGSPPLRADLRTPHPWSPPSDRPMQRQCGTSRTSRAWARCGQAPAAARARDLPKLAGPAHGAHPTRVTHLASPPRSTPLARPPVLTRRRSHRARCHGSLHPGARRSRRVASR